MREAARRALCEVGIIGDDEPMPPSILRISGNLTFLVYPPGKAFYLVKVGLENDLAREYEGLAVGHAMLPQSVPRPFKLSVHHSLPTLVAAGMPFTPLGTLDMRAPRAALQRGLAEFLGAAQASLRVEPVEPHSQRLREAFERLPTNWTVASRRYVDAIATAVDRLPAVRQHGDFSVSNLGLHGTTLVVVDWEDFGRALLPGYDIALLLCSLNDFSAARIRTNTAAGAPHAWIAQLASEATGVSRAMLLELLPAYFVLMAAMKTERAYGGSLHARILDALAESLPDALVSPAVGS